VTLEAVESPSVPPPESSNVGIKGTKHSAPTSETPQRHRRWVVVLLVAALAASPFVPKFSLWLGITLLLLCVLAFIPRVNPISHRLLKLNVEQKWRSGIRLTLYGLIGFVLILGGIGGTLTKTGQENLAAQKAAEKEEQRRLATAANRNVVNAVREAEIACKNGNMALAREMLVKAEEIPSATDLNPVKRLRVNIANKKTYLIMAEVIKAIRDGDLESAKGKITAALAVPYANALADARKLDAAISLATDPNRIRTALIKLPNDVFDKIQESGEMPPQLVSGYKELDTRTANQATALLADVAAVRTQRRQEKLGQERAQAEAARRAEAERQAQEQARQEAAKKQVKDLLDAYVSLLNAAEVQLIDNVSVSRIASDMWEATLTVDNLWHVRHYQVRLQDAQTLWEVWARIASPKQPDSARIKIVDQRGNEVGGSRVWGGSLIYVKDD